MPDDSLLLGQLADEFTSRVRAGQMPDVAEYATKHPGLAARIRELFPTLMLLEGMAGTGAQRSSGDVAPIALGAIFGNYRIERELGRGGMGVVYEAVHRTLEKRVALKVLQVQTAQSTGHLERFLREAKTAASLHHTNIVPVFDVGQCGGVPYYAMQYIEGRGLDSVLRSLHPHAPGDKAASDPLGPTLTPEAGAAFDAAMSDSHSTGKAGDGSPAGRPSSAAEPPGGKPHVPQGHASWADFFRWTANLGIQAAEGIAHAHQRSVIHRDIKPSNLILDSQGVLWITDFGLARRLDDPGLTKSGSLLGTPRYMSPEQAAAAQHPIDHRTDIYSLGASLYELLACRPAFDGATPMDVVIQILDREPIAPRRLNRAVSQDLETIVLKCMSKRPDDRYQSAAEVADDLKRWLAVEPIWARRIGPIGRTARWCRRNPSVAALSMFVALLLVLTAIGSSVAAVNMQQLARSERAAAVNAEAARQTALDALRAEEQARENERVARQRAEEAREQAQGERHRAEESRIEAEQQRNRAVASHKRAQDHLARSLYEQAHALGTSRQTGRRWLALDRLRDAAALLDRNPRVDAAARGDPESALEAHDASRSLPTRAELRSEALAALLIRDGRVRRGMELGVLSNRTPTVSADGRWLAISWVSVQDRKSGVRLVDLAGEHEERRLELPDTVFASLALSPDGTRLVTATMARVTLWDVSSGKALRALAWPKDTDSDRAAPPPFTLPGGITIGFSPDGMRLAANRVTLKPDARDRQVAVWNLADDGEPLVLARGVLPGMGFAFNTDGTKLAFPASETDVAIWDFESARLETKITPHGKLNGQMVFGLGNRALAIGATHEGTDNGAVILWDLAERRELKRLQTTAILFGWVMAVSPDGGKLAFGSLAGDIRVFSLPQGDELLKLEGDQSIPLTLVQWTDEGLGLVSVGMDGSLRQWDLSFDTPLVTIDSTLANPAGLAFSPDGRWMAVAPGLLTPSNGIGGIPQAATSPQEIKLIDRNSGRVQRGFPTPGLSPALMFRADSRQLAAFSARSAVAWATDGGQEVARYDCASPVLEESLMSCGFDQQGRLLTVRRVNKEVSVITARDGVVVWQSPEEMDIQLGFLSPDGKLFAGLPTFDFKPKMGRVWQLPAGSELTQFELQGATNTGAPVFSVDRQWMAISFMVMDTDALLRPAEPGLSKPTRHGVGLWNLSTGHKHLEVQGAQPISAYALSADNRLLAIGYRDGAVHFWDVAAREELLRWSCSSHSISKLDFTPDGEALAACDGRTPDVRLLNLATVRREFAGMELSW